MNALKHNLEGRYDIAIASKIVALAHALAFGSREPILRAAAVAAAEAHLELERVQQTKVALINRGAHTCRGSEGAELDERRALTFAAKADVIAACIRYEKRARSRRNRALQALGRRRNELWEQTAPPLPRKHRAIPEFLKFAHRINLTQLVKTALLTGPCSDPHQFQWPEWDKIEGKPYAIHLAIDRKDIISGSALLKLTSSHGFLHIDLIVNSVQEPPEFYVLERVPSPIAPGRWVATCPETNRRVEDLYLAQTERKFRSRHALKLCYRSQRRDVVQRYRARVDKIMKQVGAPHFDVPFLRPKYMRRKTFAWLSLELQKQVARMYAVIAGAPQPDFGDDDEDAT